MLATRHGFLVQLREEQVNDPIIRNAIIDIREGNKIRLKRVQRQLRLEEDILTKSGRHHLNKLHGLRNS